MTTREEIEAVASRYAEWINNNMPTPVRARYERDRHIVTDRHILADALLAERAERQRRIEAAVHRIGVRFMTKESEDAEIREIITRCLDGETT